MHYYTNLCKSQYVGNCPSGKGLCSLNGFLVDVLVMIELCFLSFFQGYVGRTLTLNSLFMLKYNKEWFKSKAI